MCPKVPEAVKGGDQYSQMADHSLYIGESPKRNYRPSYKQSLLDTMKEIDSKAIVMKLKSFLNCELAQLVKFSCTKLANCTNYNTCPPPTAKLNIDSIVVLQVSVIPTKQRVSRPSRL